jgi:hypothetical protein
MPTSTFTESHQQRLPIELILLIFEHAIDKHGWMIHDLSQINKSLRCGLTNRLFRALHLRSREKLDEIVTTDWPGSVGRKRKGLSLFLHYVKPAHTVPHFHDEFSSSLASIPHKDNIEILSVRLVPYCTPSSSLALWTCPLMPSLKRLYVDSTLYPLPYGGDEMMAQRLAWSEGLLPALPCGDPYETDAKYFGAKWGYFSSLEAYALAGSSIFKVFSQLHEGIVFQSLYPMFFSKVKRFYLFTSAHDVEDTEEQSDMWTDMAHLVEDIGTLPNVDLLIHIVLAEPEQRQICARIGKVQKMANGGTLISHVVVQEPTSQHLE